MSHQVAEGFAHAGGAVSTTSVGLVDAPFSFTAAQLEQASVAHISVYTQPIRYRYDGAAATAGSGHSVASGGQVRVYGAGNLKKLRLIREGAADATVQITLASGGASPNAPTT